MCADSVTRRFAGRRLLQLNELACPVGGCRIRATSVGKLLEHVNEKHTGVPSVVKFDHTTTS